MRSRPWGFPRPICAIARPRATPALRLFVRQARRARHDFALTDETLPAVSAICRRLDGLPLAIELVAARVRLAPPETLAALLESTIDQGLALLAGGPSDGPDRHRTMRAAIRWSYDLLEPTERALFARLSVFMNGWTLAGAEAVTPVAERVPLGLAEMDEKPSVGNPLPTRNTAVRRFPR